MRLQILLSKWFYYTMYTILLIILGFIIIPFCVVNQSINIEYAKNLYAEIWGLLFTIVLFVLVLDLKEWFQWRSVKTKVYDRINIQLSGIFTEFVNICKCTMKVSKPDEPDSLKRLQRTQLEELNKKVELDDFAKEHLKRRREARLSADLESSYADLFEAREQYLSNIEMKYFKFLDSEIVRSLMEIQDNLHQLSMSIRIKARHTFLAPTDEEFFREVTTYIHNTIKTIYKLNEEVKDINIIG